MARAQEEQHIKFLYGTDVELNNKQLGIALSGLPATPRSVRKMEVKQDGMYANAMHVQDLKRTVSQLNLRKDNALVLMDSSAGLLAKLKGLKLPTTSIVKNAKLKQRHEHEMVLPKLKGTVGDE